LTGVRGGPGGSIDQYLNFTVFSDAVEVEVLRKIKKKELVDFYKVKQLLQGITV